jgi:hypothetical protein
LVNRNAEIFQQYNTSPDNAYMYRYRKRGLSREK